jgi:hypothetical protein
MKLDDFRWSALARYHDSALEAAVVLLALARRPVHSHFDLQVWELTNVRSSIRTMTEMQSFVVNARKALESANLVLPGLVDRAKSINPHATGESFSCDFGQPSQEFCASSFWWIISRIIHSVSTAVVCETEHLQSTRTKIYSQHRDSIFEFASDFDGAKAGPGDYVVSTKQGHYV